MARIRTVSIRLALATALAAGAAVAGAAAAHQAASTGHGAAVTTVVRPAGIVDCCE